MAAMDQGMNMSNDNPTNEQELREQVLTEFKQVHKLAPADYTENCTNVVMSIVQDHTNAAIAKVLDRLDSRAYYDVSGVTP